MAQMDSIIKPIIPPTDGTITLPEAFAFHANYNPNRPLFTFHPDNAPTGELTNVTYFEFLRAADRVAQYIRPERGGANGEVIAVVALSDTLLYEAVIIGLLRAGVGPHLMSPRNTAAAIVKMMKETGCHKILTTQYTLKSLMAEIKTLLAHDQYPLEFVEMPPLYGIYPKLGHESVEDPFAPYPMASIRPDLDETMLYLHSSGSTGFPKSIRESFRMFCHWASFPSVGDVPFYSVGCMSLPPFHTLGIISQLIRPAYGLNIIGLYPPVAATPTALPVMPTPENIIEHLRRTQAESLVSIPALFQIWAQDAETVKYLATLRMATFSGGPVPSKLGNYLIASGVNLASAYGATEFGPPTYPTRRAPGENGWEYVCLSEDIKVNWEAQGDGTYECQFLTNPNHSLPIENMSSPKGYATSDLFVPHPTAHGFWKIVGRKDDVIIHTSGEKTVPAPMENVISHSPYVQGVIMFGREHDQPGVLIELESSHAVDLTVEEDVVAAKNMLWPVVEAANKLAPAFSRIFKELILIVDPSKPLPRAAKGTVLRKAGLALYEVEIEALYAIIEAAGGTETVEPPPSWTPIDARLWLSAQVRDILPDLEGDLEDDDDLFNHGMDSLGATILRRRIHGALMASLLKDAESSESTVKTNSGGATAADLINQNTIYSYPTLGALVAFLTSATLGAKAPADQKPILGRADAIEAMIAKYLPDRIPPAPTQDLNNGQRRVLVTGTTGNLGSQILEMLLRDTRVNRVYALNRPSSKASTAVNNLAEEKHLNRFADKGFEHVLLEQALASRRLIILEGDVAKEGMGLSRDVYEELRENVTVIIHSAWRLDFNLSLASFEPNVRGTRNLIDLARLGPHATNVRFLFTSSIAQALSWDKAQGPYPESVVVDSRYAVGIGYGESKYVAERILEQSGLRATSFRIGQITGGRPNGAWATSDWVPIMVKSAIALGALPSQVGTATWVPMDGVAGTMLDVALGDNSSHPRALNIVHPRPAPFDAIMDAMSGALVGEGITPVALSLIPFSEWVSLLESAGESASNEVIKSIPAIKLLNFFRASARSDEAHRSSILHGDASGGPIDFSTTLAQSISRTMTRLAPVADAGLALSWVKYWKAAGLFDC